MNLVGSGADIPDSPKKSNATTRKSMSPKKVQKMIQKNADCAGSLPNMKGDPISDSIGERKTAGSPLQVIRNKAVYDTFEITPMTLVGPGKPVDEARRSAKDRKSKVGPSGFVNMYKQN